MRKKLSWKSCTEKSDKLYRMQRTGNAGAARGCFEGSGRPESGGERGVERRETSPESRWDLRSTRVRMSNASRSVLPLEARTLRDQRRIVHVFPPKTVEPIALARELTLKCSATVSRMPR